jgi:cell wall-associated NlpC family hydrolase
MRPQRELRVTPRRRRIVSAVVVAGLLAVPLATTVLPASAQSIEDKRAEAARVAAQLAALDRELMDLGAKAEAARYELSKAEEKVAEAQAQVERTNAELDRRRGEMRTFAVKAYQNGNDSPELNALLTADGDTAPAKKSYIEVTNGNRQDLVDSLSAMRRQAEDETKALEQAKAEAERVNEEIEATRASTQRATDAQRSVNARVQGELATLVAAEQARQAEAARAAAARAAAETAARAPAPAAAAQSETPAPRSTGGGSTTTSPPPPSGPAPSIRGGLEGAIDAAVSKVGAPYVWGSAGPNTFDCSGLMVWAFKQVGISLPHYSGAQYASTTRISRSQLQPGDLVFWGSGGSEHVALYMGGNQIVHAFGSNKGTGITQLDGWWKAPTGYGRI